MAASTARVELGWVHSRNPRAAALSNEDVDQYKEPIQQMYLVEGLSRPKVISRLLEGHGFSISPDQFSRAINRWGFHKQTRRQQGAPTQSSVASFCHGEIDQVDIGLFPAPPSTAVTAPTESTKRPWSTESTVSLTDAERRVRGPALPLPDRPAKRCKAAGGADHVPVRSHSSPEDGAPSNEDDGDFDTSADYPSSRETLRPFPIAWPELTDSNGSSTLQESSVEVDELCAEFLAACYMFNRAFGYFAKVSIPFKYKSFSTTERRSRMLDLARTARSSRTRQIACVILESELKASDDSLYAANDDIGMPGDQSAGGPMTPNESFLFHRHLARIYSYKNHHGSEVQHHLDKARRFTGSDGMPNLARLPYLDFWTLHHILDGKDCAISDEILDMQRCGHSTMSYVIFGCLRWCKEQLERLQEIQTEAQLDTPGNLGDIQTVAMEPTSMSQWRRRWDPLAIWAHTSAIFAHLWRNLQLNPPRSSGWFVWLDSGVLHGISVTHFLMIVCRLIVYLSHLDITSWNAGEGTPLNKESSIAVKIETCLIAIDDLLAVGRDSPKSLKRIFDKTFCEHHSWAPPTRRENTLIVQVRAELLDCLNSTIEATNRARSATPTPPTPLIAASETTDSRETDSASLNELLDCSALEEMMALSTLNVSDGASKRSTLMSADQFSIASGSTTSFRARRLYLSVLQGIPGLTRGLESRASYSSKASDSSSLQRFKEAGGVMKKAISMAARRRSTYSAHIKSDPQANVAENPSALLPEECEQRSQTLDTSSCPFCPSCKEDHVLADNSKVFCRHVARHLRLLALASTPLAIEGLDVRDRAPEKVDDYSTDEVNDEKSIPSDVSDPIRNLEGLLPRRPDDDDHDDYGDSTFQWTTDAVQQWLRKNGFSLAWQQTFKELNIQGSFFVNLGAETDHNSKMYTGILPELSKICNSGGTGWHQTLEHDEGKRLQTLIRSTLAKPSQDSYKTEQQPLIEKEIQEAARAYEQMSWAELFEDERTRIIHSCFSRQATVGVLAETYITHVRVVEYASHPGMPPPVSSKVPSNMKPRVIAIAVLRSGIVRVHKMRENRNHSFSIGKTWDCDGLTSIENPPGISETTGVILRLGKSYYWEMASKKEKQLFISSCVQVYHKYSGGQFPTLIGFSAHEEDMLLKTRATESWLKI